MRLIVGPARLGDVLLVDRDDAAVADREPVLRVLAAVRVGERLAATAERGGEPGQRPAEPLAAGGRAAGSGHADALAEPDGRGAPVGVPDVVVVRDGLTGSDRAVGKG